MTKPIKARPTVYKGIRMRSRLEAGFATWLDENDFEWEYEPCAFATERGQYLPDFRLRNVFVTWAPEPVTVYIEVKPDSWAAHTCAPDVAGCAGRWHECAAFRAADDERFRMTKRAEIIAESEPDSWLILMRPTAGYDVYYRYRDGDFSFCDPVSVSLAEFYGVRVGFRLTSDSPPGPWQGEYWKAAT